MFFPHAVWWRALNDVEASLAFDYFAGISAAPSELSVCAEGCDCRMRAALHRSAGAAVKACGFAAAPPLLPRRPITKTVRRIESAIRRGTPVVWIDGAKGGIVRGVSSDGIQVLTLEFGTPGMDQGGLWIAKSLLADSIDNARIYLVTRSPERRGTRSQRELRGLAEWAAAALRPSSRGGCVKGGPLARHAGGLAAYNLWDEQMRQHGNQATFVTRISTWIQVRRTGAAFLTRLAGKKRSRYANLLRRAAELYEQEAAAHWEPARARIQSAGSMVSNETRNTVETARYIAEEAALLVAEAVYTGLKLPPVVVGALLEDPHELLAGVALNEVIYLARAGARPLRELAARRLAGSDNSSAVSALIQNLYDSDGRTAETALWALLQQPRPGSFRTLVNVVKNGERFRANLDYPFTMPALAAYAEMLGPGAQDEIVQFRSGVAADSPENGLLGDIDALLVALRCSPRR